MRCYSENQEKEADFSALQRQTKENQCNMLNKMLDNEKIIW